MSVRLLTKLVIGHFSRNLYFFWENDNFIEKFSQKKGNFFPYYFDIFDGGIGCATQFHVDKVFFLTTSVGSKVVASFFG